MSQIANAPVTMPPARPPARPPVVEARLTIAVAVCWTAVTVIAALVAVLTKGATQAWVEGTGDDDAGLMALALLGAVSTLLMVAAWIIGSIWLLGLRSVATAAAPDHWHRRSQIWAVIGWIVPVVSLWFPLQVVADALSAVGGRSRWLLPVWWATWLIAYFGMNAPQAMGGDLLSSDDVTQWVLGYVIAAVVMVLALPGWVMVVRRATDAARVAAGG